MLTAARALCLSIILAAAALPAFAAQETPAEIVNYQKAVRAKVDARQGEYAALSSASVANIKQSQDKVFAMLEGVQSLDSLTAAQRTDLSNELDRIKSALVANDGSKMVCHSETKIGTNISRRRCETVASREARARESEQNINDLDTMGRASLKSGN